MFEGLSPFTSPFPLGIPVIMAPSTQVLSYRGQKVCCQGHRLFVLLVVLYTRVEISSKKRLGISSPGVGDLTSDYGQGPDSPRPDVSSVTSRPVTRNDGLDTGDSLVIVII